MCVYSDLFSLCASFFVFFASKGEPFPGSGDGQGSCVCHYVFVHMKYVTSLPSFHIPSESWVRISY